MKNEDLSEKMFYINEPWLDNNESGYSSHEKQGNEMSTKELKKRIYDTSMAGLANRYDKMSLSSNEIAGKLEDLSELERVGLMTYALSNNNNVLYERLEKADKILKQKRIDSFKSSVADGTYNDFLSKMHWTDKSCLLVEMGLDQYIPREFTGQEKIYSDIINDSIDRDIEQSQNNNFDQAKNKSSR